MKKLRSNLFLSINQFNLPTSFQVLQLVPISSGVNFSISDDKNHNKEIYFFISNFPTAIWSLYLSNTTVFLQSFLSL